MRRLERRSRGPGRLLDPCDGKPSGALRGLDTRHRALHPREEKLYTFWDYTAGCWQRDLGFRLDHLLCSPEATDRLQGAGVDKWARAQEKASYHAPTWVELS